MPDRLDLPTPFNGGLIVALVLLALVALIAWAAYTARHAPWRCEVCGHLSDTLAELIVHDERHGDPDAACACGHARCRHARQCVARGCQCEGWVSV